MPCVTCEVTSTRTTMGAVEAVAADAYGWLVFLVWLCRV
jgi:hypothetical protein